MGDLNILTLDTETTGATNDTKGNPFTSSNRLCYIGSLDNSGYLDHNIEYDRKPYGKQLDSVRSRIDSCNLFVGFNLKFDLHWLRRYGITYNGKVWDAQLFEYLASRQNKAYPSLDDSCRERRIGSKIDIVKTEYWKKGIDTDMVPEETLRAYLASDVRTLTYPLYLAQREEIKTWPQGKQTLFSLMCQDLLVLEEMEFNGAYYDHEKSQQRVAELTKEREELVARLYDLSQLPYINWGSNDHISAFLFGGVIKEDYREQYPFTYKSGETVLKERWAIREYVLPAITMPLRGTAHKKRTPEQKSTFYTTDEGVLRKLKVDKKTKKIIDVLLQKKKIEKLMSTYYVGIPKLMEEMEWEDGCIHGGLNQVVATSIRLASAKPNQQNWPDEFRQCIISRFLNENNSKS